MWLFLSTIASLALPFIIGYLFCRNGDPKWETYTNKVVVFLGES